MASPVAITWPWTMLDGLYLHMVRLLVRGRHGMEDGEHAKDTSPLTTEELGEYEPRRVFACWRGIYQTSAFVWPLDIASKQRMYKRFRPDGFPRNRCVPIGSGHFRSWIIEKVICPVDVVVWYCRARVDVIERVLSQVWAIGDDVRVGYGRVMDMEIIEHPDQRTNPFWGIVDKEGRALRPIPVEPRLCESHTTNVRPVRLVQEASAYVTVPWRPPYWSGVRAERCVPPGAEVVLCG